MFLHSTTYNKTNFAYIKNKITPLARQFDVHLQQQMVETHYSTLVCFICELPDNGQQFFVVLTITGVRII